MQYCDKCNASIDGDRRECPLCQGALTGSETGTEVFPLIPTNRRRYHLLIRCMAFASSVVAVVSAALNYLLTPNVLWSFFVIAAIGCIWVSFSSAIRRRHNIPKNILWQVVILCALAVVWDVFTNWHAWSINYVIPAICVFAMISVSGYALIMKLQIEQYLIYVILDALLGIMPLIFLLMGWLRIIYPAVICVAVSILSFSALVSFAGEDLRAEIKKRMHL